MKHIRLLAALAFLVAVLGVAVKSTVVYGPLAGLAIAAFVFWLGANMLDTNWTPRARCCTNDISLTGLTELIYKARDQVAREATGFIQGCMINSDPGGVSINGTVTSIRTQEPSLNTSYTPAMTVPAATDITTSTESMTIGQVANVQIPLKGETVRQLNNTAGRDAFQTLISQSIRKIVNTIEARIGVVAKNGASRAVGTAGTTPFASNANTIAQLRQILQDNGCPLVDGDLSLVIDSSAGVNLRNLSNLYKANEAGTDATLRRGELLNLHNFSIRETAGIASHTAGTASSATTDNAGYAVGARTLTLASAGTGTLLAGDVVTFAGDSNKYVLYSGDADVSSGGTFVLNHPGLRVAMSAATKAITVGSAYVGNIGFHRSAIELVMRPIAMPEGGDAGQHTTVYDDKTGLVFDVGLYLGRGMNMLEITTVYEAKVWKPEFVATLLG